MKDKSGFTLIETIMVIVLVGIMAGVVAPPMLAMTEAIALDSRRNDLVGSGEAALRRIEVEIRRLQNQNGILSATDTSYAFTDIDGVSVDINLDTAQNAILLTRGGNDYVLTYAATALQFSYYNDESSHIALTPPIVTDEIRTVGLTFTLDSGSPLSGNVSFQTEVRPRNLPHREALFP